LRILYLDTRYPLLLRKRRSSPSASPWIFVSCSCVLLTYIKTNNLATTGRCQPLKNQLLVLLNHAGKAGRVQVAQKPVGVESYVVPGLVKCNACVILWVRESGPKKHTEQMAGKPELQKPGSQKQERVTERTHRKIISPRRRWRGSRAEAELLSAALLIICACIGSILAIPLRTKNLITTNLTSYKERS
jgi:hypothetical protein